ncbi:MAG: hypothetical protein U0M66_02220 [Bacilli bacterium]|nr:hypothetical protein [Bacilli bacterium]
MEESFKLYGATNFTAISSSKTMELFKEHSREALNRIFEGNSSLGFKFSAYAVPMIEGEIRRYINCNHLVKLTETVRKLSCQIRKLQEEYFKKSGSFSLSIDKLSELLCVSKLKIIKAMNFSDYYVNIEEPLNDFDSDDELCVKDILVGENYDIKSGIDYREMLIIFNDMLNMVSGRNRKILKGLYRLNEERKNQTEMAKIVGISSVMVSKISSNFKRVFYNSINYIPENKDSLKKKKSSKINKKVHHETFYEVLSIYNREMIDEVISSA